MNKHLKMAILIAPVLIILGYIVSDFYIESDAGAERVFKLNAEGQCDIFSNKCIFTSGDFKVNLFDKAGKTTINSTFPLDSVHLFIVDEKKNMTQYAMLKAQTKYYWHVDTSLRAYHEATREPQRVRIIVKIKGSHYIAEFEVI